MRVCLTCQRRIDDHDLEQAYTCLEAVASAARDLAARACGGAIVAALEHERRRPSAPYRPLLKWVRREAP